MRVLWLSLVVVGVGCPGLKRPPPSAQRAASTPTQSPKPATTVDPTPAPVATAPSQTPKEAFTSALVDVRAAYQAFLTTPADRAAWESVMARLQAAEDAGFRLMDSTDDPAIEEGLYELGDLRAALSEREP